LATAIPHHAFTHRFVVALFLKPMPNDCYNSFTITGMTHDKWLEVAATFQVRDNNNQHDFLKTFYPEPDWQSTPNVHGELPSGPHKHGTTQFKDGEVDNRWYDWHVENWGTKWDVYSCLTDFAKETPSTHFNAVFFTAWEPLRNGCLAELSWHFPGAFLTNPYIKVDNDLFGCSAAKDGICADINVPISRW
jgi:hypothetical protein